MERIQSLSEERPLIKVTVNGHEAVALLDTGATVSMIDKSLIKAWKLQRSGRKVSLVGASGREFTADVLNTPIVWNGKEIWQVVSSDLTGVSQSIHRQTGYGIDCIIGYKDMKRIGLI